MKKIFFTIFLTLNMIVYSQESTFNTLESPIGTYHFYKNFIFEDNIIYWNMDNMLVRFDTKMHIFHHPEVDFAFGGIDYDYTGQYYGTRNLVIIKNDKNELIKHYVSKDDNNDINVYHYYNTNQEIMENIYHNGLVTLFLYWIEDVNSFGIDNYSSYYGNDTMDRRYTKINDVIDYLDLEGLAIFRNLLFAKHNYKFSNPYWINFFKTYLNYNNGSLNNERSLNLFTNAEKGILELIIKNEQK